MPAIMALQLSNVAGMARSYDIIELSRLKWEAWIFIIDSEVDNATYTNVLPFVLGEVNASAIKQAADMACEHNLGKNINDITRLILAQIYAEKLLTFDSDFLVMQRFSSIPIEWLQ